MSALDTEVLRSVLTPQLDGDALRAMLHSRLQYISPEAREQFAVGAVENVKHTLEKYGIPELPALPEAEDARMQRHLKEMRENGITLLGPVLKQGQIKEVHDYLDTRKLYGSHVWTFSDKTAKAKAEIKEKFGQGCYILEDLLGAPHLLETMSSPFVLKLVEQYLGCVPTIFQSNLMWSFQKRKSKPTVAQAFHRDWDNFRFCVLFVYMTDVDKNTGPHQYIRNTHTVEGVKHAVDRYRAQGGNESWAKTDTFYREAKLNDDQIQKLFKDELLQIEQPAGYAFLADAFGLHRGVPLVEGERLLFWTRYGLYDNGFSVDVSPAPLPNDKFKNRIQYEKTNRYILHSLLQSEFSLEKPHTSIHPSQAEFDKHADEMISFFGRQRFIKRAAKILFPGFNKPPQTY